MRAIVTRRTLVSLASVLALIAVLAVSDMSLSQRQPPHGAGVTPHSGATSISYQVYGTAGAGQGASATASSRASSAAPAPTATTATASTRGNNIAILGTGDYASVAGSYTVNSIGTVGIPAQIEMRNTGTTTWLADWSYYLGCLSNCMTASSDPTNNIAPGQSETFAVQLYPHGAFTTATYYSQWSMFHSPSPGVPGVRFGEIATVKIVVTLAVPLGVDPAPGCDTSAMSWTVSGGACANGGLALTASAAQEPTAALQTAPSGFDDANYYVTAHVSFSGASGGWFRLVGYNSGSQCAGQGVDVQADGTWRDFYIANCVETDFAWKAPPYGPASTVTLQLGNGYFASFVNYHPMENGGSVFTGGYPVISVGGTDGSVVTVTDVELDTPVPYVATWNVLQGGPQRLHGQVAP